MKCVLMYVEYWRVIGVDYQNDQFVLSNYLYGDQLLDMSEEVRVEFFTIKDRPL